MGTAVHPHGSDATDHLLPRDVAWPAILHGIADGVFVYDPQDGLVYANEAAAELTGFASVEALLATPEAEIRERFDIADAAGAPFDPGNLPGRLAPRGVQAPDATVRYRDRATGEERWSLVQARPVVLDEHDRVRLVVTLVHDLTEAKRAEAERAALLAAAEKARATAEEERTSLRGLFEQAPAAIAVHRGPEHVYEFVNERYLRLAGRSSPAELVGKSLRAGLPELEGQGFYELADAVYASGEPFSVEAMPALVARGEGGELDGGFFSLAVQPYRGADGAVAGLLVHAVEVTEQVRARRQADEARARLEAVVRQMPVGVVIAEAPSGRFLLGNEQGERIVGQPLVAPDGVPDYARYHGFHPDGRPLSPEEWPLARAIMAGETITGEEVAYEHGDGSRGTLRLNAAPIRDGEGQIVAGVVAFDDVSDRIATEQALAESEARLQAILDQMPAAVSVKGLDGRYQLVNRHLAGWIERPAAEIVGKTDAELFAPRLAARLRRNDQAALAAGGRWEREESNLGPDGERAALFIKFPLRDATGAIYALGSIVTDITERKRAEEARAQLAAIVESADDAIISAAPDGTIRSWNEGAARLYGYAAAEIVGQPVAILVPPDRRQELRALWKQLERGERLAPVSTVRLRKDGARLDVSLSISPVRNGEGKLVALACVARDVTERNRAQRELRTRLRQQAAVAELGQRALADPGVQMLFEQVVSLVAHTLQVECAKVLQLLPQGDALRLVAGVGWRPGLVGQATVGADQTSQAGYTLSVQEPVIVEDLRAEARFHGPALLHEHGIVSGLSVIIPGRERPFGVLGAHTTARRAFTHDDANFLQAVAHVLASAIERCNDEDALRRARQELEQRVLVRTEELSTANAQLTANLAERDRARQKLEAQAAALHEQAQLLELANDAIFVLDPRTSAIRSWNRGAEAIYGWAREEAVGQTRQMLLQTRFPRPPDEITAQLMRTGYWEGELEQLTKDGAWIFVESRWALRRDERGEPTALLEINRDITDRKRAERERAALLAAEQEYARRLADLSILKADFTAMVGHELDSPIGAIRGLTAMLRTGELGAEAQAHALGMIETEIELLTTLARDVRTAARIERDEFAVHLRPVPVSALLADAVAYAATLPGSHPLVSAPSLLAQVFADPERLGQVLRNILNNAAKYSPPGAPIELRAAATDGHIRIEIQDHGCGIAPDDLPRIFEKFARGRDLSGRRTAGVGLGLYLSRRIVLAHRGDLTVASTPGQGSTFGFELEIAP